MRSGRSEKDSETHLSKTSNGNAGVFRTSGDRGDQFASDPVRTTACLQPEPAIDALRRAILFHLRRPVPPARRGRVALAARLPALAERRFPSLRAFRLDRLKRRDPLAGGRFELLLERRPGRRSSSAVGPVARAGDLDVERLSAW